MKTRTGHAALLGRPNVGKSTLLNALAGEHVSIATPKPETTRDRIIAVVTRPEGQVVVVDTPGIHTARQRLGEYMNREARRALTDADVVVMVSDASEGVDALERDAPVYEALKFVKNPVLLALNKIDRLRKPDALLPLLAAFGARYDFAAVVPISASTGDGVPALLSEILSRLPEGTPAFPADTLTDRSERYLVAERVREAVIHETAEELPYVTAVEIDRFDEGAPIPHIAATIHVERPGQKKIVVGTGGERIKAIGIRARKSIEKLLGRHVFLELWVKVSPEWTRTPAALERLGYGDRGGES